MINNKTAFGVSTFLLACAVGSTIIWGIPSIKKAYSNIKDYSSAKQNITLLQSELTEINQSISKVESQIGQMRGDSLDLNDKLAVSEAINSIDGINIDSISALRLNGLGDPVVIATLNNINDVANLTDSTDSLEYTLSARNVKQAISALEDLKLNCDNYMIIPTSNTIIIRILFNGGVDNE